MAEKKLRYGDPGDDRNAVRSVIARATGGQTKWPD